MALLLKRKRLQPGQNRGRNSWDNGVATAKAGWADRRVLVLPLPRVRARRCRPTLALGRPCGPCWVRKAQWRLSCVVVADGLAVNRWDVRVGRRGSGEAVVGTFGWQGLIRIVPVEIRHPDVKTCSEVAF